MLTEPFLSRLHEAFPDFYGRVDEEARIEAQRLLTRAHGDVEIALARARMDGAARLWWPYVQGSVPKVGNEAAAREALTRLVLTVDHVVGYAAPDMEAARTHVMGVLRHTLDVERLARIARRKDEAGAAVAGAGIVASGMAFVTPIGAARRVARAARWLPVPARFAVGGLALTALASIPVVVAYSAGQHAEKAARAIGQSVRPRATSIPLERSAPS